MVANLLVRAPSSLLLEPTAPPWAQRFALRISALFKLVNPQAPVAIWPVNKADLPPADQWSGCMVWVPDQGVVGFSDGASWRRIVLGGPV